MFAWLVLFACGGDSDAFTRCEDADCRVFMVVESYDGTPESVLPLLQRLEDPTELTVAMNRLREADPRRMGEICEMLPEGHARRRCHRIHSRPHLEGESREALDVVKLDAPTGGPSTRGVLRRSRPRFAWVTPVDGGCGKGPESSRCVITKAVEAAGEGSADRAASLCAALPRGEARDGCMARAAHAWVGVEGRDLLVGNDLCLAAGEAAWSCLGSMLDGWLGVVDEFADLGQRLAALHRRVEERDAGLADLLVDRAWARAFSRAYSTTVSGSALVGLPPEALPHQRAAAARYLLSRETPDSIGLEAWVQRLQVFLGEQGPELNVTGALGGVDYWPVDQEGESEREARVYLDTSRRTVAQDSRVDSRICILEAAARNDPPVRDLLEEGSSSSDEAVRWTASRLLGVLEGQREAGGPSPWGSDHWSELPATAVGTHHDDPNYGSDPAVPGRK